LRIEKWKKLLIELRLLINKNSEYSIYGKGIFIIYQVVNWKTITPQLVFCNSILLREQ